MVSLFEFMTEFFWLKFTEVCYDKINFCFKFYKFNLASERQDLYIIDIKHNQPYPIKLRTNFTNNLLQQ